MAPVTCLTLLLAGCPTPVPLTNCTTGGCPDGYECRGEPRLCYPTGLPDRASSDAAVIDAAMLDTTVLDAAGQDVSSDSAAGDSASLDFGSSDVSPPDSATDAGAVDAPRPDAMGGDSPIPDAHAANDVAVPSDAAAGADVDAGIGPAACGTVRVFRDDFATAGLDRDWGSCTDISGAPVMFTSGQLVLFVPANSTAWPACTSNFAASLQGTDVSVELVQPPASDSRVAAHLSYFWDTDHFIQITLMSSSLGFSWATASSGDNDTVAFDHAVHRWWRIREGGGTLHFETAPQPGQWTEQWTAPAPLFSSHGKVELSASQYMIENDSTVVIFDNLNTDRTRQAWCPAHTLTDDFARASLGFAWGVSGQNRTAHIDSDTLVISVPGDAANEHSIVYAQSGHRLESSEFVVQIVDHPAAHYWTGMTVWDPAGLRIELGLIGTSLIGSVKVPGQLLDQAPATIVNHRWLRISESGNVIQLSSSANPSQGWVVFHTHSTSYVLNAVGVELSIRHDGTGANAAADATFDNVGLPGQ